MDVTNVESLGVSSQDVWADPQSVRKEITERHKPVNYSQIVGDARVLFLAENHSNRSIRKHIISHARDLKEAGITHYAIEAKEEGNEALERLNKDEQVDLSSVDVGPGGEDYKEAVRAMAAQGIKVVAVDIDQTSKPTRDEREAHMTKNLLRILEQNPDSKIAYLVGGFHTSKRVLSDGLAWTGKRIIDAGVKTITAYYAGGEDDVPRILIDGARKAELANTEFVLDMRPYASSDSKMVPYGAGETDYVIHLPQESSPRPNLLSSRRVFS
jgi:CheY-like chemotaxis protein